MASSKEDTVKKDKSEVSFEHPAKGPHHCHDCIHWIPPEACQLVAGTIKPGDWCKLFKEGKAKASVHSSPIQALRKVVIGLQKPKAQTESITTGNQGKSVHAAAVRFQAEAAPAAAPAVASAPASSASSGANPVSAGTRKVRRDKIPHPKDWLDDYNLVQVEEDDESSDTEEEETSEKAVTGKKSWPKRSPMLGGQYEQSQVLPVTKNTTT